MPCGAHCFILYLQAGFHLSPPLSFCAEDDLKAKQPLLLLSGLYAPHPPLHPEEEESNQAECLLTFLTCTVPLPPCSRDACCSSHRSNALQRAHLLCNISLEPLPKGHM